jgi:hypothetical protein
MEDQGASEQEAGTTAVLVAGVATDETIIAHVGAERGEMKLAGRRSAKGLWELCRMTKDPSWSTTSVGEVAGRVWRRSTEAAGGGPFNEGRFAGLLCEK